MNAKKELPPQRNAFAPSLIGAAAMFVAPALLETDAFTILRYVVAILAAIVAVFAVQARQWWWAIPMAAIVVVWNPVYPFDLPAAAWMPLHIAGAVAFLAAGALIKVRREG